MSEENGASSGQANLEFASWRSYWHFRREVTRIARYIYSPEATKFLETVVRGAQSRTKIIKEGHRFYRAQVAHADEFINEIDDVVPAPASPDRMMPFTDRATEGRINPKGIPCLYVATHEETAIAETRPWIGSLVSVAVLKTLREQRVVDCTDVSNNSRIYLFEEPPPSQWEEAVWNDIAKAFREPVTRNDDVAEYTPTQILAEAFKNHGFDGVAYRSAFGTDRYNVALFDISSAEIIKCSLHEIRDVDLKYREVTNPYCVQVGVEGKKEIVQNVIVGFSPVNK
jgi:hypothetical protein